MGLYGIEGSQSVGMVGGSSIVRWASYRGGRGQGMYFGMYLRRFVGYVHERMLVG